MKILYVFIVIISIILSPLFSFPEKDAISRKPQNEFNSRITITGPASITIINNDTSNYGPFAKEIVTTEGGKINHMIKEKNDILIDIQTKETDETLSKSAVNDLPSEFVIEKVYPNPFNPIINVRYGLPDDAPVKIVIHDIQGRLIDSFFINNQSAGWNEYVWNGTDYNGQNVGTGVYLFTIHAGNLIKKQKITFLK